ncbi:hypothetical protein [Lentzea atacamensis]|uniref:hypothetical protein n=1 Tax=Lentzea atacamensis TaxID=531938 RepID=UPI001474DEEF|nr:hypothetical protein [Lentzea atacamensis]
MESSEPPKIVTNTDAEPLQQQLTEAQALAARLPELETAHQVAELRAALAEDQLICA